MKLRRLDPKSIVVPAIRVTARMDEETLAQFRASLGATGQLAPIICIESEGKIVLVDGLHRLQAALDAGDSTIDAVVSPGDMADVLTRNILSDHLRGKVPVSEMVVVIHELTGNLGLDSDAIRERTGLSRDYIERLQRIGEAGPEVLAALDAGAIGVGHAYELSRLPHMTQRLEVLDKVQLWRWPVRQLKELVDATLREIAAMSIAPPPGTPPPPPPKIEYHCEGCKQVVQGRDLRPVMICPTCFGRVWRLARESAASPSTPSDASPST